MKKQQSEKTFKNPVRVVDDAKSSESSFTQMKDNLIVEDVTMNMLDYTYRETSFLDSLNSSNNACIIDFGGFGEE